MKDITFYIAAATGNTGDYACLPGRYFPELFGPVTVVNTRRRWCKTKVAVYGGGTLAHVAQGYRARHGAPVSVMWGAGSTVRWKKKHISHHNPEGFALYGRRDAGPQGEFTSCGSCMAPEFDTMRQPTTKIAVYSHKDFPVPPAERPTDAPFMHNYQGDDIGKVLDFMGQAEEIYTSSFHGMLWAKWLGRKVKVFDYSSKFHGLPEATLEEARELNRNFAQRVADLAQ